MTDKDKQGYEGPFKFSYPDDYEVAPAVKWQVQGVLPKGGIIWFYGPPKSGKTYVAVSWVGCVQSGHMWTGLRVEQTDCVYLALEGHNGIVRRHIAWKQANGVLRPTRTALIREPVNMRSDLSVDSLMRAFDDQGRCPGFIVIDTYQRASADSDITSPKETAAVLKNVDRLRVKLGNDPTILFVSHNRKNDDRFLGAQNIYGWVDGMITLTNKDGSVTLSCEGFRDGEEFDPITLHFDTTTVKTDEGPQTERAIVGRASFEEKLFAQDKAASKITEDKERVVAALRAGPLHFTPLLDTIANRPRLSDILKGLVAEGRVVRGKGEGHRPYILVGDGSVAAPFSSVGLVSPPRGGEIPNQNTKLKNQTIPIPNQIPNPARVPARVGSLLGDAIYGMTSPTEHNIPDTPQTPHLREVLDDDQHEPDRLADRPT